MRTIIALALLVLLAGCSGNDYGPSRIITEWDLTIMMKSGRMETHRACTLYVAKDVYWLRADSEAPMPIRKQDVESIIARPCGKDAPDGI